MFSRQYDDVYLNSLPVRTTSGVKGVLPEIEPSDVVHAVRVQVDVVRPAVAPHPHREVGVVGPIVEVDLRKTRDGSKKQN